MTPGMYRSYRALAIHLITLILMTTPLWVAIYLLIARPLG